MTSIHEEEAWRDHRARHYESTFAPSLELAGLAMLRGKYPAPSQAGITSNRLDQKETAPHCCTKPCLNYWGGLPTMFLTACAPLA